MSLGRGNNMLETFTWRESCCFADDAQGDLSRVFTVKNKTSAVLLFKMILDNKFLPCKGNWTLLSSNKPLMTCQYTEEYTYNIYIQDEISYLPLVDTDINYKDLQLKRIYDLDKTFDHKFLFCHRKYDGIWSDDEKSFFQTILSYLKARFFE